MTFQLFHINTLLFAEGSTEFLHLGSKAALGILSGKEMMLSDVRTRRGKGVIRSGSNKTDTLDQGLTLTKVIGDVASCEFNFTFL
jgi:hypothetical protein